MPFTPPVAAEALVASGRHCCLCHRFCGVKIELHHITPESEGGSDELDNCIPLCFDCHAEVGHYNSKHPRGRKFSPTELRLHRDRWFERVASNAGPVANERQRELDKDVLERLRAMLPRDKGLYFIRTFDYAAAFDKDRHDFLRDFTRYFTGPEHEFVDADLEGLSQTLRHTVGQFLTELDRNTWPIDKGSPVRSIPEEWSYQQVERFERARQTINDLADAICTQYDGLLRLARIKYGVLRPGVVPIGPEN